MKKILIACYEKIYFCPHTYESYMASNEKYFSQKEHLFYSYGYKFRTRKK